MNIGLREISNAYPVCIVAEISCNHAGSLDRACELIRQAKLCGADVVKTQCYEPADLTCDSRHAAYRMTAGAWRGRRLWNLYTETQTPRAWFPVLAEAAHDVGIPWFASVFSASGLAFLERLDCPAYKIASAEVADADFVRAVAEAGKPVILSDGMATARQLACALEAVGDPMRLAVLRCVSEYPAQPESYRLSLIRELAKQGYTVGVSDHTLGNAVVTAAVALGARIVEKHLMLERGAYGDPFIGTVAGPLDAGHSLTPFQFAEMVTAVRQTEAAVFQPPTLGVQPDAGSPWRRRLVFARDLPQGHRLTAADLRTLRCGMGLEPNEAESVLGLYLAEPATAGDPVRWFSVRRPEEWRSVAAATGDMGDPQAGELR